MGESKRPPEDTKANRAGKYAKATDAEVRLRVELLAERIVRDLSDRPARKWARKAWNLSGRQVAEYVERALDLLAEERPRKRALLRARATENAARIMRKALKAGEFSAAVAAASLLSKIEGTEFDNERDGDVENATRPLVIKRVDPRAEPVEP